ncbi:GD17280 [Drosophila simulans]|uniref:GD17280 n=1 Tax=Drosophila simulans TaxID=7240 RepID=B4R5T2_DROSI|nr:GD17280 [Drosophila simulans]
MSCFSAMSAPLLGEMEQTIGMLERGTIVTKLYGKQRRPDRRHLMLIRETRQLLWATVATQTPRTDYEGAIQLREIREIRVGKHSKEFRLFADDCQRFESSKCFVILHGNHFKLKSFSVVALSEIEADNWGAGAYVTWSRTLWEHHIPCKLTAGCVASTTKSRMSTRIPPRPRNSRQPR